MSKMSLQIMAMQFLWTYIILQIYIFYKKKYFTYLKYRKYIFTDQQSADEM